MNPRSAVPAAAPPAGAAKRNLAVGHFLNAPFKEVCARNLPRIRETFFAWPGVLSCRPAPDFTPELRERMVSDLRWARENGVLLDTLFNCNCYGERAVSSELADFAENALREMDAAGLLPDIVTTTSPFLATMFRRSRPALEIRLSVNMRVHGSTGFEPVAELFDSFYVSREIQREPRRLAAISQWARANGKKIGMQANSGCLRQCAFQQFHDNMHGHNRIAQSKAGEALGFSPFLCKTHFAKPGSEEDFLRETWLRPEDMPEYEPFVDVVKLATRRHPDPAAIVDAYAGYRFAGDTAALMDARHVFPRIFRNEAFDSRKAKPLWDEVRRCPSANDCAHCGKCAALLKEVYS